MIAHVRLRYVGAETTDSTCVLTPQVVVIVYQRDPYNRDPEPVDLRADLRARLRQQHRAASQQHFAPGRYPARQRRPAAIWVPRRVRRRVPFESWP